MSAKDDATFEPARRTARGLTLVLATLAGAAIGIVVALLATPFDRPLFEARVAWDGPAPSPGEWPREARIGESAHLERVSGTQHLVVVAPRAPQARALAAGLIARHEAGIPALMRTRRALLDDWRTRARFAPAAETTPAIESAALVFARARQQRDLAAAAPAEWASVRIALPVAPAALVATRGQVATALAAGAPAATLDALVADARAEDDWFATGVPSARAPFAQRGAAWRAWQLASADSLVALAAASPAMAPAAALDSARAARELALVRLAVRTDPPFASLLRFIPAGEEPETAPIPRAWGGWLGLGAALGALGALLTAVIGTSLRRPGRREAPLFVPVRDPGARGSWLHVVSGPSPAAVARAAIELSAHALARGERVLVVDGGPRLKLHERFGREARWGLMECLVADMPIVGLVQYGGRPGFYLLAHGTAGRGEGWAALGQRLDDARPHFGRVVLALDPGAPRAIGESLAGRALEGWWAEPLHKLPRTAIEFSDRMAIAMSGMDLSGVPELSLEALGGRLRALAELPPAPVTATAVVEPEPAPLPAPLVPREPIVLDCDLQVRQRLQFLAWMRRVQSERRRVEAGSTV